MVKLPRSVQLKMYRQELLDHENDLEDTDLFHALLLKGKQLHSINDYQFHYWEESCKMRFPSHAGLARIMVLHYLEKKTDEAIRSAERWEKFLAVSKRMLSWLMKVVFAFAFFFVTLQYARWAINTDHPFLVLSPVFFLYALFIWYRAPNEKD
jgi:hypothetical protein